jgi:CheY-like chemotaxis protein
MILFVDDERRRMRSYVEAIELSHYQVKFESDVDDALEFFEKNCDRLKLLILDVMMPTGNSFDDEQTNDGLRTGICFYQKVRKLNPDIPVIVFTNFRNNELTNIESEKTSVFHKDVILPFELANKVDLILSNNLKPVF